MRSKNKLFNLAAILLFTLVFTIAPSSMASAMEGNGTSESPYLISTVEDFDQISAAPSAHYLLTNDLDFQNVERASIPEFGGVLDGAGFTLSNLNLSEALISTSTGVIKNFTVANSTSITSGFGNKAALVVGSLRGSRGSAKVDGITVIDSKVSSTVDSGAIAYYSYDATIENCKVINSTVNGGQKVGTICALANNTEIYNCQVIGGETMSDDPYYAEIGGIIGYSYYSTIKNTSIKETKIYTINSQQGASAGGLTGYSKNTRYDNCSSIADIYVEKGIAGGLNGNGDYDRGGTYCFFTECYTEGVVSAPTVAGYTYLGYAYIKDCYAKNTLISTNSVDGLGIGFVYVGMGTTIENSYCASTIDATDVIPLSTDCYYINSYYNNDIIQSDIWAEEEGRTQEQLFQQSNYEGWDFDTVWYIDEGMDYPRLRNTN